MLSVPAHPCFRKEQTMKDTIYREDAIKAIHNYWKKRLDTLPTKESEYGEVYADIQQIDKILEHNRTLCNFIKAIPSADRPQEWIPCSERMPSNFSEDETVLATTDVDGDRVIPMFAFDVKSFYLKGYISAWMPLPKPWKGADDE